MNCKIYLKSFPFKRDAASQPVKREQERNTDVLCPTSSSSRKADEATKTSNNTPDAAYAFQDREKYLKEHDLKLLRYFIYKILPHENVSKILSDDVLAAVEYATPFIGAAYE